MFKRKCKITFITHGATVHSLEGMINDSESYPKLNDVGEEEISKVCEYLKKRAVSYDKVYTSPSARCIESAQIIAKLFKKKSTEIDLKARKYGVWSGQTFTDIYEQYGAKAIIETPEGGEDLKAFNTRVNEIFSIGKMVPYI